MFVGTKYAPAEVEGPWDVIVIGSGIGGLSTAALLARAGRRVLVLERHYTAGGFTHSYTRKGYEWDVGVHYIGKVHEARSVLRRIFDDITDGALKWAKMDRVYDRIVFPDATYDFVEGEENFREGISAAFPGERDAIAAYLAAVGEVRRATRAFFSLRAMPRWLERAAHPLLARPYLKHARRTTLDFLRSLTGNERLIGVLCGQYGDYGLPPGESSFAVHAMVVDHYLGGGAYPVGGASRIARTIVPVIERAGGRVVVRAEVTRILVRKGRATGIQLTDGAEIEAPIVVSDAGVWNTFTKLLPAGSRSEPIRAKLERVPPSLSHLCLYVGLRQEAAELGLPRTNLWIYPGYDHDANLQRYRNDRSAPLPVAYVSFPSAKDPEWPKRHPGRATVEVIGFAPYEWFRRWEGTAWRKRGTEYEAFKAELSERLLDTLYRHVPQVRGKVDYHELSTPLSTAHFCNYGRGEIYGVTHAPARFAQRWLLPRTPIRRLFLTGQDIVTAGVGGALFGGVLAASAILGRNALKELMRRTAAA